MNGRRAIGIVVLAASLAAAWFASSGAARMRPAEPALRVGQAVRIAGTRPVAPSHADPDR